MKKTVLALGLIATGTLALAHAGATGIVKERMDGMGELAKSMKALINMNKSSDIDAKQVAAIAQTIQSHSGVVMTDRFPEGSLPNVSEAAPLIWTDWDRFAAISDELFDVAQRMETSVATQDFDLGLYVKELGATCSACHSDFRIKK